MCLAGTPLCEKEKLSSGQPAKIMILLVLLFGALVPILVAFFLSRSIYRSVRKTQEKPLSLVISFAVFLALTGLMWWGLIAWVSINFQR
jgi:VIT1/CCC1 family predicted Fe2+/Mn2+ transporter